MSQECFGPQEKVNVSRMLCATGLDLRRPTVLLLLLFERNKFKKSSVHKVILLDCTKGYISCGKIKNTDVKYSGEKIRF